ncbi:MAG: glycosyltransferase family 9 protein [Solirubrobacterales bacterium]
MSWLINRLFLWVLGRLKRPTAPSGILLVSARGPAEMVFLAAVLPRFMRLSQDGEPVTLLLRSDAMGMTFLFPRALRLLKVDFGRLAQAGYRWQTFRKLYLANYRMVVSLDHRREVDPDEMLIAAARAAETVAMQAAGARAGRSPARYTRLFDAGPARQDKILRWSRYADFVTGWRMPPSLALMPGHRLPEAARLEVPTVVLFPFSGVAGRQLRPELWTAILDALPKAWHARIACHQADLDRNPQYQGLQARPHVTVDTSGFDHLASVLRGARMVIGADTAGTHLSILLGVPTLCLASAAFVGAGTPYDDAIRPANAHFLFTPMECQGCLGRCPLPAVDGMFPCVARLEREAVLAAVGDMIARGGF